MNETGSTLRERGNMPEKDAREKQNKGGLR